MTGKAFLGNKFIYISNWGAQGKDSSHCPRQMLTCIGERYFTRQNSPLLWLWGVNNIKFKEALGTKGYGYSTFERRILQ